MSENPQTLPLMPASRKAKPGGERANRLLSAHDLHKTYQLGRVEVPVLKGASTHIDRGEWVAVLGASGSGKSTLLHLLGALDRPDVGSGGILFEGQPISEMSQGRFNRYRNKSVGFVFQFYHLLPELTVLENTFLPGLVGRRRWYWFVLLAAGILPAFVWEQFQYHFEAARLRSRAEALLNSFGLGHRLRHRPRELSGGERQRVAIARALMNNPQVLLADEPTGNLDEKTGQEILDLIAEQHRQGLTIVMVTHDPAIAQRADRVVHLHDGQVVEG